VSAKGSTLVLVTQTTRSYILVLPLCIYHVASHAVTYDNQTGGWKNPRSKCEQTLKCIER